MDPNTTGELRKTYKITVIIGVAMMAIVLFYAAIVEFLKNQSGGSMARTEVVSLLRTIFLVVAVVELFAIPRLRKLVLRTEMPVVQGRVASTMTPEAGKLLAASVATFALCDTVAIFGFVLFVIGRNANDFYLFLAISLFYFAIFFPRFGTWEEWVQERERAARRDGQAGNERLHDKR